LIANEKGTELIPFYAIISQGGIDLQYTKEAWLWKFEGITRSGQGKTFAAAVGGFEYTLYQVFSSVADIRLYLSTSTMAGVKKLLQPSLTTTSLW
jgi:hypothetical protein